jgi:tetratricopeptide (TPR) repeat protein
MGGIIMSNESAGSLNNPKQKPRKLSSLARSSVIVSFIFIIPVLSGLAAIILGIAALCSIAKHKDALRGRGFAIAGMAIGLAQLLLFILVLFLLSYWTYSGNAEREPYDPSAISSPKENYNYSVKKTDFYLHNKRALSLQAAGKPKEALEEFERVLEIVKKEAGYAYYGIGSSYMDLKEYDKAIVEFNKAIDHNPMMYDAYQNKAVTYRLMGRFQDSVDACKKTISLFPDFPRAYCSMGWAYEHLGKYKEAINAHLEAIRLSPEWQFPKYRIDHALSERGDEQYSFEVHQKIKQIIDEDSVID